jgi:virginiamycin B lyase
MKHFLYFAASSMMALATTCTISAQTSSTITEYHTPTAASFPQGVDVSLTGNVWYAETSAGKIAERQPNGSTTEFLVPNGGQPFIVKVALDGLWFTYANKPAIGHLNPETGVFQQFAIPSGASPFFIQVALDGSKWFTETSGVGRLKPDGSITEWTFAQEHPDDNIEQLSLDLSGNIWFTERNFDGAGAAGTNKVRRLNPGTNLVSTFLVPTAGGNPAGILANLDGTVWVSEYFANAFALLIPLQAPHTDAFVSPATNRAGSTAASALPIKPAPASGTATPVLIRIHSVKPSYTPGWIEYPIPSANAQAEDMRTDLYGRLWFEEDNDAVGVLNRLTSTFSEYTVPSQNSGYYNIVLDLLRNKMWFTEAAASGTAASRIASIPLTTE